MELIYTTSSVSEANEIKQRLDAAGIPVMISGKHVNSIQLPFLSGNLGVFIYINNQYQEAMALIADPDYQVQEPVDVDAFYRAIESQDMKQYIDKKTNQLIVVLFLIVVLVITTLIVLD